MKKKLNLKSKKLSKKTLAIIGGVIVLIAVTAGYSIVKSKEKEEPVTKQREYPVKKGDITIGVKGLGSIKLKEVEHNFDEVVTIGEVFVKEGQEVKAGDKLMSISSESLQKKLDELNDALKKAKINLNQQINSKNSTQLNNKKSWNDSVNASKNQYENDKNQALASIDKLNKQIEAINNKIKELEADLEGNKVEIEAKKAEKETLEQQLSEANQNLSNIEVAREKQLEQQSRDEAANRDINDVALQDADNSIKLAELEVEKINKDIENIKKLQESPTLFAKVDGIVSAVGYTPNSVTTPETPAVKIGSLKEVIAKVNIEESDINDIEIGQLANIEVSAFQGEKITGKVKEINLKPTQESSGNVYKIDVEIDPNENKLIEGMGLNATFVIKEAKDILTLSNKAIILQDGKQFVKVKNADGTLKDVEIKTGFSDGRYSEIISGLSEGDVVVIGG
ncbi:MAG: efflux RND transporter periplasmic adaptor subunit [Clostridium celatum]|nr:efflux RND transporter periplasmic adaptor subunit [Clostridium celatum]